MKYFAGIGTLTLAILLGSLVSDGLAQRRGRGPEAGTSTRFMRAQQDRGRICNEELCAILAHEGELNLTREQKSRLREIMKKAYDEACAILTPAQMEKLRSCSSGVRGCEHRCRRGERGKGSNRHRGRCRHDGCRGRCW